MGESAWDPEILAIAHAIRDAGGRALVVGGYVRDRLMGLDSHDIKDIDIEVYGLSLEQLDEVLGRFGTVMHVGRAFGVLRVKGLDVDFSLPRRDSKVGAGHRGFHIACDPTLDFAEAARRRDLTINSMSLDPLTGELIDPHGGQADLQRGVLRATDPLHFPEDPLRGVRVAQFAARFEMQPDADLVRLCATLDLSELSAERLYEEFRKLLLKGKKPSIGFEFLRQTQLLRFFPELQALVGVPQDPIWHPEGDVWTHTMMVIDQAARLRMEQTTAAEVARPRTDQTTTAKDARLRSDPTRAADEAHPKDDLALMFGALCHDFGKPETTVVGDDGRVRSPSHDAKGVPHTERFMARLAAPKDLTKMVCALVEHHLAPALFVRSKATPKGYRRLARKLEAAGVSIALLVRVARADHLGRTTPEALEGRFDVGEAFLRKAEELAVADAALPDVVLGRHLMALGMKPGPQFGEILRRCREVQDEQGWTDPDMILRVVLAERPDIP